MLRPARGDRERRSEVGELLCLFLNCFIHWNIFVVFLGLFSVSVLCIECKTKKKSFSTLPRWLATALSQLWHFFLLMFLFQSLDVSEVSRNRFSSGKNVWQGFDILPPLLFRKRFNYICIDLKSHSACQEFFFLWYFNQWENTFKSHHCIFCSECV